MNSLKISADREGYTIGLTGILSVDGFSGFGQGGFNNSDVTEFCSRIQGLAIEMNGMAELIGAVSNADGSEYLERFALRCDVLSESKKNGIIGVHVTLSESPSTDCREQEILKVSGELQVRNHKLQEFSEKLNNMIKGNLNKVTLVGDLNDI